MDRAGPGLDILSETTLVLDDQGRPHTVYSNYGVLKYAYRSGNEWKIEVIDDENWAEFYYSLALDSLGQPRVSYFFVAKKAQLRYAARDQGEWTIDVIDHSAGWLGEFNALALDAENQPHVSYLDATAGLLKYATYSGGAWQIDVLEPAACGRRLYGYRPRLYESPPYQLHHKRKHRPLRL